MLDPACLPSKRRRLTADAPLYEQPLALSAPAAGPEKLSPTTAEQAPELPALLEQPPELSGLAEESPEQSTPADNFSQLSAQAESLKQSSDLSPAPEKDFPPAVRPAELSVSATPAEQLPEVPSDQRTDLSTPPARDSHKLSSSSLLLENGALAATTNSDPAPADGTRAAVARTTRSKARSEPGDDVLDSGHVTQVVPHVWRTTRSRSSALAASQSASSPLGTSSGLITNGATVAEDGVAEIVAVAENTALQNAAAENLVMDKAVSEKASAGKALTEKSMVEKTAAERVAAEKAAAEKAAAEKAAAEELALSADVKRKRRMMTLRSPYRLSLYFSFIVSVGGKIICFASFHLLMKLRQEPV
jgi:hypothetical protein